MCGPATLTPPFPIPGGKQERGESFPCNHQTPSADVHTRWWQNKPHPQFLWPCPKWDPSTAATPLHLALVELESTREAAGQRFCSLQHTDFTQIASFGEDHRSDLFLWGHTYAHELTTVVVKAQVIHPQLAPWALSCVAGVFVASIWGTMLQPHSPPSPI